MLIKNNKLKEEENNVELIINELKRFQTILDNESIKMKKKDLREWCGHNNFIVTFLIEEFQKLRENIQTFLSDSERVILNIDEKEFENSFYV